MPSHHNFNSRINSQASTEANDNAENNPTPCETRKEVEFAYIMKNIFL